MTSTAAWTPDKTERFKKLVLRTVAHGGTLLDACTQFEYETNGVHKARMNQLRWYMSLRSTCKEEYRRALELGAKAKVSKMEEVAQESEASVDMENIKEDELSNRLFTALEDFLEDRRQLKADLGDYTDRVTYFERQVQDLEEEKKLAEMRLEKKDKEVQRLQQDAMDKQFKYDQLLENYNQLRTNDAKEHERLQQNLRESQLKNENLTSDYSRFRATSSKEIEKLEAALRDEQIRLSQLQAQYELVRAENVSLTKRITDFAQQISSIVPVEIPAATAPSTAQVVHPSQTSSPTLTAVPIRPSVVKDPAEDPKTGTN